MLMVLKPLVNVFSAGNTAVIKPSEKCSSTSKLIKILTEKYFQKVDIQDTTLETIRRGLRKVVTSGTGMGINIDTSILPPVAGKTGTAEDSSGGSDHAGFAGFAPYDSGEIVVVAFAQNTPGGGSVHALPMAKKILQTWYQLNSNNQSNSGKDEE